MDLLLERSYQQPLTEPIEWLSTPQGARRLTIHGGFDRGPLAEVIPGIDLLLPLDNVPQALVQALARSKNEVAQVTFGEPNPVTLLFPELKSCPLN